MTEIDIYQGPETYMLADWRRRINDLYAQIRATPDPETGWELWRAERTNLYCTHPMSPVPKPGRATLKQIAMFDYNPALRFHVALDRVDAASIRFQLDTDGDMRARPIARTQGLKTRLQAELTVYWIEGYGGGLFIPFKDVTSGTQTYGGGRYLVDAIKGSDLGLTENGELTLDFNFAYSPSCAWTPDFVCPLSPPENSLPTAIEAGEKTP
jgi:uncharacterized protein (DUF1684 family)